MTTTASDPGTDAQLVRQLEYCVARSPYYRRAFAEHGIDPARIRSIRDLEQVPVLVTPVEHRASQDETLRRDGHPFGDLLCAEPETITAVSSTSGTTGTPVLYPFTAADVATTDGTWARAFRFMGLAPGDGMVVGFGLSMYLAGTPLVRAGERYGLRTVAVGAESGAAKLLRMLEVMRPRVLACTPSYAAHLVERAPDVLGRPASALGVEVVLCAGEPGAGLPAVREALTGGWGGARVHDILGGVHGVMNVSCSHPDYTGMHVLAPDLCLPTQLVDPTTREPLEVTDGVVGERVKTALAWEATPPVRYSVGDINQVFTEPCPCGVPGERVRVVGRVDDLLMVKGVKLYPVAVKDTVATLVPEVTGELRIVLDGPPPRVSPPLRVTVEAGPGVPEARHADIAGRLGALMHQRLSVRPEITVVPAGTLERTSHKATLIEVVR